MFTITPAPDAIRTFNIVLNMPQATKSGIRQGLYHFGSLLRDSIRIDMLKPKSGREYLVRRGGRRFRHIAAADGETPANISGKLRRSVDFKVSGANQMEFGYDSSVDYGKFLELGTRKMGAKPGLKNSIDKNKVKGINIIAQEINKRIQS